MPLKSEALRRIQAEIGLQEFLRIDAVPTPAEGAKLNQFAKDAGALAVVGDYDMIVDVAGITELEVVLRAAAVTGSVTPQAFATYADGTTSKIAASGAVAFVAATRQTLTLTGLKGVRKVIVRIPIAASTSVTLDQAEANGA